MTTQLKNPQWSSARSRWLVITGMIMAIGTVFIWKVTTARLTGSDTSLLAAEAESTDLQAADGAARRDGTGFALTDPQGFLPNSKQVDAVRFYSLTEPDISLRSSGIFVAGGDEKSKIYHHVPVCARVKTEKVPLTKEESVVFVTYASSSKSLREMIAKYLTTSLALPTEPRVLVWPITGELVAVVKDRLGQEIARAQTLKTNDEQFRFTFYMTSAAADRMVKHPEEFATTIYFPWEGRKYTTGGMRISGSKNVGLAARLVLSSRDPSLAKKKTLEGHYLVGDEIARLSRVVAGLIDKAIYADSEKVFYLAEKQASVLAERMLETESLKELNLNDLENHPDREEIKSAISDYIRARLKVINESSSEQDVKWEIKENASGKAVGGGVGVLISPVAAFGTGQVTDRDLERLMKGLSTIVTKSSTANVYIPHEIRVAKIRKGYEKVEFNENTLLHFPLEQNSNVLVAPEVPMDFTLNSATESLVKQGLTFPINQYVGAVFVTLSNVSPGPGWVNATDGMSYYFPNEPWVPTNLQGRDVSDFRDAVLLGVGTIAKGKIDESQIGVKTEGASGTQTIKGERFTLGETQRSTMYSNDGSPAGGRVGIITLNPNYQGQNGLFTEIYGGKMDLPPAYFESHKKGDQLYGEAKVLPMPSVKAVVWIYGAIPKPDDKASDE